MSDAQTLASVKQWEPQIAAAAQPYGIPGLVPAAEAIMAIESGGAANVGCSGQGACGLMQVVGGSSDPTTSIQQGVAHLAGNYQQCHSWDGAAAAYFSGSCDTASGSTDALGTSVQGYVSRFDAFLSELGGASSGPVASPDSSAMLTAQLTSALKSSGLFVAALGLIGVGVWVLW